MGYKFAMRERVNCSAWLSDWEDTEVSRISEKASAVANLTLFTAEQMQVCRHLLVVMLSKFTWFVCVGVCTLRVLSAWLSDWEDIEVARISDRASTVANLTLFTAEPMQVTMPQTTHKPHYQSCCF